MGAMALFGEKYGSRVRVVRMGDWSLELCAGTHLASTAEVGLFHLSGETGIGSGLRRVEAMTGRGVLAALDAGRAELRQAATSLRCRPDEVAARVAELQGRLAQRDKELAAHQQAQLAAEAGRMAERAVQVAAPGGGFAVAHGTVTAPGVDALRSLADALRGRLGSGAALLASRSGDHGAVLLCALTPDLVARGLHAGRVVAKAAAAAGGRGGGRPDLAHAGAADLSRLGEALDVGLAELRQQAGA